MNNIGSHFRISISNLCFIIFCCIVLFVSSCKKDDDDDTFATRDDYLGSWQCEEFDQNQQFIGTFQVEIMIHPTVTSQVMIDNFTQLGFGNIAYGIIDNTSITLSQQIVGGISISGNGYITDNLTKIEFLYSLNDGSGQPEQITATYTKL